MGPHTGFLVATASQRVLLGELSRHAGEFAVGDTVERMTDLSGRDEVELVVGERDGSVFLTDRTLLVSDSADMIVAMSERLGTVLGCGAETVSGSYWLTAARDGGLLRHLWASRATMIRDLTMGSPLPSEDEQPVVDISGSGVFAAMAGFGLDPTGWLHSGPATVITYDYSRVPADGPIAAVRDEHLNRYRHPDGEQPRGVTVMRGGGDPPRRWRGLSRRR